MFEEISDIYIATQEYVRVGASVGHGEQTRLGVLQLEVLIGELLAVDGLATSTLDID